MLSRFIIPAALGTAIVAGLAPTAASAQSFGVYVGNGYPGYYGGRYGYGYDERREAWLARQRWQQRHEWQEEARRRYWARERWENGGNGYRGEGHREWHHDDEDD